MDTNNKVNFVRNHFKMIGEVVALHALSSLVSYTNGLITAWSLDGSVGPADAKLLNVELEQVSNEVRNRFENNEG